LPAELGLDQSYWEAKFGNDVEERKFVKIIEHRFNKDNSLNLHVDHTLKTSRFQWKRWVTREELERNESSRSLLVDYCVSNQHDQHIFALLDELVGKEFGKGFLSLVKTEKKSRRLRKKEEAVK
jgi:hypothetical protein